MSEADGRVTDETSREEASLPARLGRYRIDTKKEVRPEVFAASDTLTSRELEARRVRFGEPGVRDDYVREMKELTTLVDTAWVAVHDATELDGDAAVFVDAIGPTTSAREVTDSGDRVRHLASLAQGLHALAGRGRAVELLTEDLVVDRYGALRLRGLDRSTRAGDASAAARRTFDALVDALDAGTLLGDRDRADLGALATALAPELTPVDRPLVGPSDPQAARARDLVAIGIAIFVVASAIALFAFLAR